MVTYSVVRRQVFRIDQFRCPKRGVIVLPPGWHVAGVHDSLARVETFRFRVEPGHVYLCKYSNDLNPRMDSYFKGWYGTGRGGVHRMLMEDLTGTQWAGRVVAQLVAHPDLYDHDYEYW